MWPFSKKLKPIIIGVCGRSCSGKSTVVKELEEKYKGEFLHINQDKFFKVKADNWESPDALRMDRLIYSIKKLKNGQPTHIPSHRWTEVFDREVKPHKIIIVEGYLLFVNEELANLFDKKIWVDVSDANIVYRRTKRDSTSKYIDYTVNTVIPESKKYEEIQRNRADIVINGNKSKEEIIQEFEELLGNKDDSVYSLNRCQNMLLGIAIGDAFGAGYEMKSRGNILNRLSLEKYHRKDKSKRGKYTDDTQMSIAVIELLLSNDSFTKERLAQKFVEVYHRDVHSGYSSATKSALKNSRNGKDLLHNLSGDSIRNGACMRAVPLGILPNLKDVIRYSTINAETTHNSPKGITSSVCIAAASHYFYYGLGKPSGIFDFCIDACKGLDKESLTYFKEVRNMKYFEPRVIFGKENEKFGVPCDGMRTAGAVLYILSKFSESSKQTLSESVLLGGDVDSVASIALGITAINQGIKEIPTRLIYGLENGKYGRDYLISLGEKLSKKWQ
jgi:ADP-ribosylglycohydrolase/dephospho-CoA kinase